MDEDLSVGQVVVTSNQLNCVCYNSLIDESALCYSDGEVVIDSENDSLSFFCEKGTCAQCCAFVTNDQGIILLLGIESSLAVYDRTRSREESSQSDLLKTYPTPNRSTIMSITECNGIVIIGCYDGSVLTAKVDVICNGIEFYTQLKSEPSMKHSAILKVSCVKSKNNSNCIIYALRANGILSMWSGNSILNVGCPTNYSLCDNPLDMFAFEHDQLTGVVCCGQGFVKIVVHNGAGINIVQVHTPPGEGAITLICPYLVVHPETQALSVLCMSTIGSIYSAKVSVNASAQNHVLKNNGAMFDTFAVGCYFSNSSQKLIFYSKSNLVYEL
ncbi:hypothetical protein AKO1_005207, partial [Acrasis kona]